MYGGGDDDDKLNTLGEETLWTGTAYMGCTVYRKLISVSNFRRHEDTNRARKKMNMKQFH
jgi:hypothetical protein